MTPRIQSFLALGGALLLGMVIGGLLTGAFIGKRARTIAGVFLHEERFVHIAEQLIEPNAQQKDSVHQVLSRYGTKITTLTRTTQREQIRLFDSLRHDVMPLLTPEQQERLVKQFERMDRRRKMLFRDEGKTMP